MEPKLSGCCVLFSASFLTLQCFVTSLLQRTSSVNIADGLVIPVSSNDITRPTFYVQESRSFIECAVICIHTKPCLSVYFEHNSSDCFLNDDFLPQYVLMPSYTPSPTADLLGWDPRGLVNISLY